MRQTSDQFMDQLLKENEGVNPGKSFEDRMTEILDNKIEQAMSKFTEQFDKINPPDPQPPAPEEVPTVPEDGVEELSDNSVDNEE